MPFCSNCGNSNPAEAQHCANCGLPIEQPEVQQVQDQPQTYNQPVSQYGGQYQAPKQGATGEKSFFASLFDFSFKSFIYVRVLGIIYGFMVFLITVGMIFLIIAMFGLSTGAGIAFLIVSPIIYLYFLICGRMSLEFTAVLFQACVAISRKY
jgi:uncharacterized membrane protein YvbJ